MGRAHGNDDNSGDNVRWRQRLRYRFDNLLARGTWAVLLWLGIVTFAVVLIASFLLRRVGVTLAGSTNAGWFEDFWQSLLRTLDSGTMAGDTGLRPRLVALGVTIFGLLVAGTVIGVIASGVEAQVDRMKRGRSAVVESDHIVVLGSSSLLPVVVDQLLRANAGHGIAIVVMSDGDPVEVGDDVRRAVESMRGNRLVFRSGDPTRVVDLALVRLTHCRSVIVLNSDGVVVGDARAAHTVLAVREALDGLDSTPVVVVLDDVRVAAALGSACGPTVHPLVPTMAVARSSAFALRERGLGQVLAELTDFTASDIYVRDDVDLVGERFEDVVLRFERARPLGRLRSDGSVQLNPPRGTTFEAGDCLVVLAEGSAPLTASSAPPMPPSLEGSLDVRSVPTVQQLLVIGWNEMGAQLLGSWAGSAAPGSHVEVVYDPRLVEGERVSIEVAEAAHVSISFTPSLAGAIEVGERAASDITAVALLAYRDRLETAAADSRTLVELLALRREFSERQIDLPRLVVELLDPGNVALVQARSIDDVLVTPATTSRLIAQLADDHRRRNVYAALYDTGGPSIHLVAAERLGVSGSSTMRELVVAGLEQGALVIGWWHRPHVGGALVLNAGEDTLVTLAPDDELVVVA